jgi:HK97 family phage portal protein
MRNPFKRREKALTAAPAVLDALVTQGWTPYPLLGGGSRDRILDVYNTAKSASYAWMYANSPAVRTVIDCIVRNVGQLDLRLYKEVSEAERTAQPDHPAAMSLRYPNETTSADQFIRQLFKDFLIFDDATALLMEAAGQKINMNWVPFHMIEVRGSSLFQADLYRYWRVDGSYQDFPPANILHWHGENPTDPRIGISHLDTLRDVVAEDAALRQATVELANAGLTEPTWVFRPLDAPEWSPEARDRFEEDLTARLRRRNKTPVVMEEGMEMRSFGVSPRDAQMMEIRRWAIEQCASEYGVPLGMVGLADNLEEAQKQFYSDTLPPYCESFTKMLNQRICVRVYNDTALCFEFNLDEKHMGDDRLKSLTSASGRPVLLTNEARAMVNRPPVPGGDELVTPANVIVGDNPKPSTDVMPIQDPNGPPQDGSYRQEPKSVEITVKAVTDPTAQTTQDFQRLPQYLPSYRGDQERNFRNIERAKGLVERHYGRLERSLRAKGVKQVDWDRWEREFADDIHALAEKIVRDEGTIYAAKLLGEFDMEHVHNYVRAMSEGAAKAINDMIRKEIDELGLDDALNQRPKHVESAGAGLGGGATRWAREEAARQSPDHETRMKVWIPDTQRHAQFGGQRVPLGDNWPAGFAPGTAPGCRCTMAIE